MLIQPNRCFCHLEGEGKAHHSFHICPKALHGFQIQCCNKLRRIGVHQKLQDMSKMIFEEDRSAKIGPDCEIGAYSCIIRRHVALKGGIMVLHSFSACSKVKGSIWIPYMILCDKLWAITLRTKLLDKNRSGPKCQLWPRQPNLSCWLS